MTRKKLDKTIEKCNVGIEVNHMRDRAGSQNNQIKNRAGIIAPERRKAVLWRPAPPAIMSAVFLG